MQCSFFFFFFAIFLHVCKCNVGIGEERRESPHSRLKWMLIVQSHVAAAQSSLSSPATRCSSFGSSLHVEAWTKISWSCPLGSNLHLKLLRSWVFFPPDSHWRSEGTVLPFFKCLTYRFFFFIFWQAHLPHSDGGFVIWLGRFDLIILRQNDD